MRRALWRLIPSSAVLLVVAELASRAVGFEPHTPSPPPVTSQPEDWLVGDERVGWTTQAGTFQLSLAGGVRWTATHRVRGERWVPSPKGRGPRVLFVGDSVPYGFGVSDAEAFPALIAAALPTAEVHSLGVPGHSVAQTREVLRAGSPIRGGDVVVLAYASWLDERTVWLRHWRRSLAPFHEAGPLGTVEVPVVRDPTAPVVRLALRYRPLPLQRTSALVHAVDEAWSGIEHAWRRPHEVTRALVETLWRDLEAQGGRLIVLGVSDDPTTLQALDHWRARGLSVVEGGISPGDRSLTLAPRDPHPSAAGHQHLADAWLGDASSWWPAPEGDPLKP